MKNRTNINHEMKNLQSESNKWKTYRASIHNEMQNLQSEYYEWKT